MPRRGYSAFGLEQTRPHLWLPERDLDLLNELAKKDGRTFSELIESIVRFWCDEQHGIKANRAAEKFAADKAMNGDDSWQIRE